MSSKYDITSLVNKIKDKQKTKDGAKNFTSDFWRPTIEKGEERVEYVIRFLPNPDSVDGAPNVDRYSHMVNFPNGKYISNPCSKKAGKEDRCFICEEVDVMFKSKVESKVTIAKQRYAKARFYYNILVIKDPREDGKNEGKVFLFEAGKQIQDKCTEFICNEEIEKINRCFYHPLLGTNFKLVVTIKSDYSNYDKSDFMRSISPLEINGKKIKSIEEGEQFFEEHCFKLNEYLFNDKSFKTYDEIKELYENQGVVSKKNKTIKEAEEVTTNKDDEDEDEDSSPKITQKKTTIKKTVEPVEEEDESSFEEDESNEDDSEEDDELARLLQD